MKRLLEPEVMDTEAEAQEYDAMDFREVNSAFATDAIAIGPEKAAVLDTGTGTARIPILIAQQRPQWQITAIDLADSMLAIARRNVAEAGLSRQITLAKVDSKELPYPDNSFDLVISNSIVHHIPDPLPYLREIKRVLRPQGGIFLRDLLRPDDEATVERLVSAIGPEYSPHQAQLFRDSLCAAFTIPEIEALLTAAGLGDVRVDQSSDRHWTARKNAGF
ncbi:MAG: class I SAM-dependent methyltransferase [Jaaginema sp. PMC 1079.18]|nr:class I SAM-dependent methyltransferase [Jaaginema sp. PMC 1080.18]MEC4853211.1 class I SAM-dependent methyltransferase [Jaaginema sp. PMC 1079.18]MEC4866645.1 class I SAM-dependent methyltransferase [Jaaginema sp. PMC 1078.18]